MSEYTKEEKRILNALKKSDEFHKVAEDKYLSVIRTLSEKNKIYREALEFYADSYNYGDGNGISWECVELSEDRGKKARQALKEADEE